MGKKKVKDRSLSAADSSTETAGICMTAALNNDMLTVIYNHETSHVILMLLCKGFPALTSVKE